MPKHYDTREVRDTIGALDFEGVAVKEIWRRLRAGECGLKCGSIGISERQVYNYRIDYRAEHGQPVKHVTGEKTLDSISSVKQRCVELAAREVATLESKRAGSMTAKQAAATRAIYKALIDMERWEEQAVKRRGDRSKPQRSPSNGNGNGSGKSKQAESALERLAALEQAPES